MSQLMTIIQLGNPILRQPAKPVENISDRQIQQLIDDLIATAAEANGVGIAAPQIAQSYQIFIVASHPSSRYPDAPDMEPTAIINPQIINHSEEMVKGWEGCLSIPGIRGLVPRYQEIEVTYTDRNGLLKKQSFTDFVARIFQHEIDHLHGISFLDRLVSNFDIITEQEYQKRVLTRE
ncbi:peptide deformylase [Calothrix rhizosoleniae]|uniref:peptide deformylase n=1 Tax=Calothrix rhizosoleniae TaxID=888997 RepID=UPI000B4A23A4|nr:peptide deformylase [Calothrix rhizosoleniae]